MLCIHNSKLVSRHSPLLHVAAGASVAVKGDREEKKGYSRGWRCAVVMMDDGAK